MEMIDDSKRPLWREAPGEQMRSQISSLSLSHSLSVSVSLSLSLYDIHNHKRNTHKQRPSEYFDHFLSPFIFMEAVKAADGKKNIQGKGRARKKSQTLSEFSRFQRRSEWLLCMSFWILDRMYFPGLTLL